MTKINLKQEQIHDCREKCGLLSYLAHFLANFKLKIIFGLFYYLGFIENVMDHVLL